RLQPAVASLVFAVMVSTAAAETSAPIRIRGSLTDLGGSAENLTNAALEVRIYSTETGGSPLYIENYTYSIANGTVDLYVGGGGTVRSGDSLVAALAISSGSPDRWLEISINGEALSRLRLTGSLFAVNAASLGGHAASEYALLSNTNNQTFSGQTTY